MNNESYDFEDRKYANPTLSRDEQLSFIDNFRNVQRSNADEIARTTHELGTDVSSNLGGLTGAESIWTSNYVTPKVNSIVSGLKSTAQAQALNDVLSNYQSQMTKRYNDAYRAAKYNTTTNNNNNKTSDDDTDGDVDYKANDEEPASNQESASNQEGNTSNVDTVTAHPGLKKTSDVFSTNSPSGWTTGDMSSGANTYWLVSPDGSMTQFNISKNATGGTAMDTPMYSIGGSANIKNKLGDYIKRGYRVKLHGGQDISLTYKQVMGL